MKSIKLVLFDFDDTLFLKKKRIFISSLLRILQHLRTQCVHIIVISCNHKASEIISQHNLSNFFDEIIHVNYNLENKSKKIKELILPYYDHEAILFFDNDPFHIYDVVTNCHIRSFLVNADYGLREEVIGMLVDRQYKQLRSLYLQNKNHPSFVEKVVSIQNLTELEKMDN